MFEVPAGPTTGPDCLCLPVPSLGVQRRRPPAADEDTTESERRRQPELARAEPVVKPSTQNEFEIDRLDDIEDEVARNRRLTRLMQRVARQASLDPGDGVDM